MYVCTLYITYIRERFISGDVQDKRAEMLKVAENSESLALGALLSGNVVPYKV